MSATVTHFTNCFLCGEESAESSTSSAIPKERSPLARTSVQMQDWDAQCEQSLFRLLRIHSSEIPDLQSYYCTRCWKLIRDVDFSLRAIDSLHTQILHLRRLVLSKLDSKAATLDLEDCRRQQINSSTKENRVQFRAFFKKVQEKRTSWSSFDFLNASEEDNDSEINQPFRFPDETWCSTGAAGVEPITSFLQPVKTDIADDDTGTSEEEEDVSHFCLVVSSESDETPSTSAAAEGDFISSRVSSQEDADSKPSKSETASANNAELSNSENDSVYSRTSKLEPYDFHVDRIFQCSSCPKKFKWKHHLKQHVDIHAGKVFACADCNKTFPTLRYLQLHRKRHQGKVFTCPDCPLTFPTKLLLRRHCKTHVKTFQCPGCAKTFATVYSLRRHQKYFQQAQGCAESESDVILGQQGS